MGSSTCRAGRWALAPALLGLGPAPAAAQAAAPTPGLPPGVAPADTGADSPGPVATLPDGTRRVRGRVVTPRDRGVVGVAGEWVTLHRVARDAAGPLDSARTDASGAYAFTYRPRGDARAIYFVSTSRGGVAYFGSPLTQAVVEGQPAELLVYDTTSAGGRVQTTGRHLIVARAAAGGTREVLEVFELTNDSSVTFVPPAGASTGVWSTPLPAGATRFAVRESSDVPADGLVLAGGRAALMVPVAPGLKQVAFSYTLPADAFPLRVPVAAGTGVFEVLIEDPRGTASGAGVAAVGPTALEGKSFQRFVAQDAQDGATVDVRVSDGPPPDQWSRRVVPVLLGVVGGAMAVALVAAGARQRKGGGRRADPRPSVGPAPVAAGSAADSGDATRERLLAELAALDDAHARGAASSADDAAYQERRAAIKRQLAAELAGSAAGR